MKMIEQHQHDIDEGHIDLVIKFEIVPAAFANITGHNAYLRSVQRAFTHACRPESRSRLTSRSTPAEASAEAARDTAG